MSSLLQVRDLNLYYGDAQALADVSLEVARGEIVAIVGANGAGKTSLIRTIAGIERCRSGEILFAEKAIQGLESHAICNLIKSYNNMFFNELRVWQRFRNTRAG